MLNAVNEPGDALHPLAKLVFPGTNSLEKTALPASETGLPVGARVVVNFENLPAREWFADGVGFGNGPVRAGELQIFAPPGTNGPVLRIPTRGGALVDANWRDLDLSPGAEREPASYGTWKRDGVTLRSPKFELKSGRIYYLVRGGGRVLASVDSQRLVTGPVHTDQLLQWPFQEWWRWVAHNLSDYPGHRVAIEFSPGDEFETAIAMIIESEQPPTDPLSAGQRLAQDFAERGLKSVADLAAAYQEIFSSASKSSCGTATDERPLEIENWLARRPELFSGKEGEWPGAAGKIINDYLKERQPIFSRIQWKSRTAPAMMEGNAVDE